LAGARFVSTLPSLFCVGGVQVTVAEPFEIWLTVIVNAASEALVTPSLTEMTMFEYVPTLAAVGVPARCPVPALKVAQAALPVGLELNNRS
jgi:hypothetical protein